ncbi:hypothetical protein [Desulfonema ishimotonii]|uniref:hypothetical protein n=1 Tax=Desulfonema ishimotonii TaxID=45657 RepID=UPI000F586027|nr:hypothetical protein [Desulfonema ishimotonii]
MNSVRLMLKGVLADLKKQRLEAEVTIAAKIRAVRQILATASLTPIAELDLASAATLMAEASDLKSELMEIRRKIGVAEGELA